MLSTLKSDSFEFQMKKIVKTGSDIAFISDSIFYHCNPPSGTDLYAVKGARVSDVLPLVPSLTGYSTVILALGGNNLDDWGKKDTSGRRVMRLGSPASKIVFDFLLLSRSLMSAGVKQVKVANVLPRLAIVEGERRPCARICNP